MAVFKKTAEPWLSLKPQPSSPTQPPRVVEGILPPPNRAATTPGGNPTYLDKGSRVNGKLNFDGPVRIDGEIEGEINSKDSVAIGEGAIVSANIKAVAIVVAGAISGELSARQRIEVYSSAKVLLGSLTAPEMVIGEGAVIEGTRIMQPKAVGEDRKRLALDERLARFAVGMERVEVLFETFIGGFARVDGAALERRTSHCRPPLLAA
jgi:cytoskeletal protein CcmA (bactofilin family)